MPYTYVLKHLPTNKRYYGVRYANGCDPSELMTTYFTSSKEVKRLAKEDPRQFEYSIRRQFTERTAAIAWESKVLRRLRAKDSRFWFNKTDNRAISYDIHPRKGVKLSQETKDKISSANSGKRWSAEAKAKMSLARAGERHWNYGNSWSSDTIDKNRATNLLASKARMDKLRETAPVRFVVKDPEGKVHNIQFMRSFCKEHGFNGTNLCKHGKTKGWILLETISVVS